jgi:hypothetical protein
VHESLERYAAARKSGSCEAARFTFDRWGLRALAIYLAASFLLSGLPLVNHLRDTHVGVGPDSSLFTWFLVWWPHAIAHRLDPFFTKSVWSPQGINLAWTTLVPLPALIVSPITIAFGPVAAFNILCFIASPLAGWNAFLLCRQVSKSWWPSLIGGYLFGFSAYMAGHQVYGQANLLLVLFVPVAALIAVRGIFSDTELRKLISALTVVLVAQFLVSIEVFATMTVAGAIALLLGWSFAPEEVGARLRKLLLPISKAYILAALILSPYLYALFALGSHPGGVWSADAHSNDLMNFALPVATTAIGTLPLLRNLTMPFRATGFIAEMNGYVGLPVLVIAVLYAWKQWREPLGRTLVEFLIIFMVLSLGPRLRIDGVATIGLPFKAFLNLPLLDKVLPARLMMYGFLALGLITALWLESAQIGVGAKSAVAAMVVISTLPSPSWRWVTPLDSPALFATQTYRHFLKPTDNVLILPFGIRGDSMYWHAETVMSFNLVGGYTGPQPDEFSEWRIADAFAAAAYLPDSVDQMAALLAHYRVDVVIVSRNDCDASSWDGVLTPISTDKRRVAGVNLYRVSAAAVEPYRTATQLQMRQRSTQLAMEALVFAADKWRSQGNDPTALTPSKAVQSGLLRDSWFVGPNTIPGWVLGGAEQVMDTTQHFRAGAWLGGTPSGDFGVGLFGSYAALQPIIAKYRATASHVYFPYPNDLLSPGAAKPPPTTEALLTLVFDRRQLARAASSLRTAEPRENALLTIYKLSR